jgi:phage shock protein PspC (stress-responsive transcriptional regulator)
MTQQTFHSQYETGQQYPVSGQPYRVLRRSRDNRMLAGICGGLARYLNIDPVAARLLFVVATVFTGGTTLLAYLIAWPLIPEDPTTWTPTPPPTPTP